LDELARKLRKEVVSKTYVPSLIETLLPKEEEELRNCLFKDLTEIKKEIYSLRTEKDLSKTTIQTYENAIKTFQSKIKAIIGDDLTN